MARDSQKPFLDGRRGREGSDPDQLVLHCCRGYGCIQPETAAKCIATIGIVSTLIVMFTFRHEISLEHENGIISLALYIVALTSYALIFVALCTRRPVYFNFYFLMNTVLVVIIGALTAYLILCCIMDPQENSSMRMVTAAVLATEVILIWFHWLVFEAFVAITKKREMMDNNKRRRLPTA